MSKAEQAKLPEIRIRKWADPPPKHLVVNDLRKGTGATVGPDDAILINYFSDSYAEALKRSRVGAYGATRFGMNEVIKGWEVGLLGMKVGGRRELIVPPRLHYQGLNPKQGAGKWTDIYVIDLLAVYPREAGSF